MKMRSILNVLTITSALSLSTFGLSASVDVSKSTVNWTGKKVSGEHVGTVALKSGSFDLSKGMGEFVIDMKTITDTDLDGEWKDKLETHLKSPDFFNVEKFPEAKFVLKKAEKKSDTSYNLAGDLTVKGITNEIKFPATVSSKNGMTNLTADLKIDRLKWDIKYNSGKFFDVKKLGDKLIYDDIEFKLNVVAK